VEGEKTKQIFIGRVADNDVVINFQQVSSKHAVITPIGANSVLLEDLGSTNGTFVNGTQIHRVILTHNDRVKIANILLDTNPYFSGAKIQPKKAPAKQAGNIASAEAEDYKAQFQDLKIIWDTYQMVKINHKKQGFWKNMGLTVVGMGVGGLLLPGIGLMVGSMVGRGAAGFLKNDEKLQVMENEFKVNYICPKCKVFLGYYPHEGLVARKKCFTCKTNWI
jgi:hypothetical protein